MATLDLAARLDNVLSTAQKETADIDLFAPIPAREECPLCMIPLPFKCNFNICCGKRICNKGCDYKHIITELKKGLQPDEYKCAFCQQVITPKSKQIKCLKKLMKKNNPYAFMSMGQRYRSGDGAFQSYTKSLEMHIRAAELDHANAYAVIGFHYDNGIAVEEDAAKALAFYKIGAKKGSIGVRVLHCFIRGTRTNRSVSNI